MDLELKSKMFVLSVNICEISPITISPQHPVKLTSLWTRSQVFTQLPSNIHYRFPFLALHVLARRAGLQISVSLSTWNWERGMSSQLWKKNWKLTTRTGILQRMKRTQANLDGHFSGEWWFRCFLKANFSSCPVYTGVTSGRCLSHLH